ncbi:MAG: peptide deformylase [Clostridia bacterium]|nr:peptide deformylase [Clostridia bacterium]
MAVRNIFKAGDDVLRKRSRPVQVIDRRIRTLLDDMAQTMYAADGAGLAAPQVGILRRVVVIDVGEGLVELINPEILSTEGSQINPEGCLSIPGRRCTVERPQKVVVRAYDRNGDEIEVTGEGFMAMAICHEIDHLDGILYTDKMIEDVTDKENEEAAK